MLRIVAYECKKVLTPAAWILLAASAALLFALPFFLRESVLSCYATSEERREMYALHEGYWDEEAMLEAERAYSRLPKDKNGYIFPATQEERDTEQWLQDVKRKLKMLNPSEEDAPLPPATADARERLAAVESGYAYETVYYGDTDGWEVYFSVLSGAGAFFGMALPCFLLASLFNGEVTSGMRRVGLSIAWRESAQAAGKWAAALVTALLSAAALSLAPLAGAAISMGLPGVQLSARLVGAPFPMTIGAYFALRLALFFLGSLVAAGLTAGASGWIAHPVGAAVVPIGIFLLPMFPLPQEAPRWLVSLVGYGPSGFFTGNVFSSGAPVFLLDGYAVYPVTWLCLIWLVLTPLAAVSGVTAFRRMKIPEEFHQN